MRSWGLSWMDSWCSHRPSQEWAMMNWDIPHVLSAPEVPACSCGSVIRDRKVLTSYLCPTLDLQPLDPWAKWTFFYIYKWMEKKLLSCRFCGSAIQSAWVFCLRISHEGTVGMARKGRAAVTWRHHRWHDHYRYQTASALFHVVLSIDCLGAVRSSSFPRASNSTRVWAWEALVPLMTLSPGPSLSILPNLFFL